MKRGAEKDEFIFFAPLCVFVNKNDNRNLFYICMMTTLASVKQTLTELKPELQTKYGVSSIGLFGSIVRDDFTPSSDIDIVVDFDRPIGIEFVHLGDYLEERLNKRVDLVSLHGIKPRYFEVIEPQIQYV